MLFFNTFERLLNPEKLLIHYAIRQKTTHGQSTD